MNKLFFCLLSFVIIAFFSGIMAEDKADDKSSICPPYQVSKLKTFFGDKYNPKTDTITFDQGTLNCASIGTRKVSFYAVVSMTGTFDQGNVVLAYVVSDGVLFYEIDKNWSKPYDKSIEISDCADGKVLFDWLNKPSYVVTKMTAWDAINCYVNPKNPKIAPEANKWAPFCARWTDIKTGFDGENKKDVYSPGKYVFIVQQNDQKEKGLLRKVMLVGEKGQCKTLTLIESGVEPKIMIVISEDIYGFHATDGVAVTLKAK
ncbi:MAG: hypothetical protein G01um101418_359 [Parcubacteria group bacterium Gr01-1014_18]|nr:MAG: hypothetical protein Greene041636_265 [Parcubacteria group bacterium Greene0416_36]TSC81219.1 MAG: hypothetical protein G01um101418_359 [Parcubacteria group bacterium Gr01-1014_18]TSC99216.1 MAG: hypothetical protein Greene101420_361 [Parcubacteria group bacterium Greene1014_20]TSD07426.1 MAG: hypothetical protein Greene07142_125 [Parcubacteria group bacterium Greene0714_2]